MFAKRTSTVIIRDKKDIKFLIGKLEKILDNPDNKNCKVIIEFEETILSKTEKIIRGMMMAGVQDISIIKDAVYNSVTVSEFEYFMSKYDCESFEESVKVFKNSPFYK